MKISELKGRDAIDALADIMLPACNIVEDVEVRNYIFSGGSNLGLVHKILKTHPEDVLDMMAVVDQEDRETYAPDFLTLPKRLIELFSMPEIKTLFFSRGQKIDGESSGSATESIEEAEE